MLSTPSWLRFKKSRGHQGRPQQLDAKPADEPARLSSEAPLLGPNAARDKNDRSSGRRSIGAGLRRALSSLLGRTGSAVRASRRSGAGKKLACSSTKRRPLAKCKPDSSNVDNKLVSGQQAIGSGDKNEKDEREAVEEEEEVEEGEEVGLDLKKQKVKEKTRKTKKKEKEKKRDSITLLVDCGAEQNRESVDEMKFSRPSEGPISSKASQKESNNADGHLSARDKLDRESANTNLAPLIFGDKPKAMERHQVEAAKLSFEAVERCTCDLSMPAERERREKGAKDDHNENQPIRQRPTPLAPSSSRPEMGATSDGELVCHLTAKTSDNHCALHGAGQSIAPISPPAANAAAVAAGGSKQADAGRATHKTKSLGAKLGRRRRDRARKAAMWPLGRSSLSANGGAQSRPKRSFGDCEDISSAHLSGRLAGNETNELPGSLVLEQSNYNHRRPFGKPFERPMTGWVQNAVHKISPFGLKAKLLAASNFRRKSYDDQVGDNDINFILQPSDLHDIEKEANFGQAAYEIASLQLTSNPNSNATKVERFYGRFLGKSSLASTSSPSSIDLDFAKSLLDQDYNLTVRLFIRESALNWNFNSFTFDALCCGRSLTELLLHLFDYYNLYKIFNLNIINVLKCFRLLEFGYHSTNPYHNSIHAADVTQAMHCFIQENKIRKHMTHLEILCSILAAVCHDLDHPGVNQSFLVATKNPLASLYNNNSVLENHHWRFALCIFKESQLFEHFEENIFSEMKCQLKQLILATDIARQNEYLKRFKDLTSSHQFSMQNTDDRALVLQMALKCADLGNPCRPWLISRVWSNLICDEFYKMGRIERQLGIPLTPICQREKTSIAGIQTDFFRFIVLPLLELWHNFLRSPLSSLLMSNFEHNYQRWQRANRIVQQLRRRKSVACFESMGSSPMAANMDSMDAGGVDASGEVAQLDPEATVDFCSKHSFGAIKRASSDYIKSGNRNLEFLRNFHLDRIIEKSPLTRRADKNCSKLMKERNSGRKVEREQLINATNVAAASAIPQTAIIANQSHKDGCGYLKTKETKPIKSECCPQKADSACHRGEGCARSNAPKSEQYQKTRCAQSINPTLRNVSNFRKALSPIEDGDAPSPDQHKPPKDRLSSGDPSSQSTSSTTKTTLPTSSAFPASSRSRCEDAQVDYVEDDDNNKDDDTGSSSASSSLSQASSACSSPVIQRSISSRTSMDKLVVGKSALHLHHHHHHHHHHDQRRRHQQKQATFQHRLPFLAQYYEEPSSGIKLRPSNLSAVRQSTPTSVSQSKSLNNGKRRESDPGCCADNYGLAAAIVLIKYQKSSFLQHRRSSLPVCVPKRRSSK